MKEVIFVLLTWMAICFSGVVQTVYIIFAVDYDTAYRYDLKSDMG